MALAGVNDIDSLRVSEARPLEGVGSHQVAGLLGELHSPDSVLSSSLHDEGVVIADQVPNQSVRHFVYSIKKWINKVRRNLFDLFDN